jgi:folate-binding protein YgfZ
MRALDQRQYVRRLEIDAATVLFPIAVSRWIGAITATDFLRWYRWLCFRRGNGQLRRSGDGSGIAYHRGVHSHASLSPCPMSDNPQPMPIADFALTDHRVLTLGGRDATAFAQAQFMNEVTALAPGHWQWNGWLTPKGRVVALFALLKFDAETLWLLLPDADPAALALQLQRFVFRSKVVVAARDDLLVSGAFALPVIARGSSFAGNTHANVELDLTGEGGPRTLRIGGNEVLDVPDHMTRWMAFDVMHGLPRLPESQSSQWTPQQLSLDRLQAYSVKKGCYPGQEIVARTHFLGKAKRGLALFDANARVAIGGEVHDGERTIGTVVSAASDSGKHRALAVLPLERDAAVLHVVAGIALDERPLLGGLAR